MKRPRRRSLFWVVAGAFLLVAVLGTLAQGLLAVAVLGPLETREIRARAELFLARLQARLAALPQPAPPDSVAALLARERRISGLRVSVLHRGADGVVLSDPASFAPDLVRSLDPAAAREPPPPGTRRFELLERRALPGGGELAVMRFERPRGGLIWGRPLLLAAPVALLMSLAAGLVLVRLLVRRLRKLETLATRVAAGDFDVRVEDASGDEIGRLAERLNRMTERLAAARDRIDRADAQRRQLFADITHELATPITAIRGTTETLLDPAVPLSAEERARFLANVLAETRRLDRLIRDLFELARLEAGAAPLHLERLDWVALGRHAAERFEPRFRAAGLRLAWRDSVPEAWIEADGLRLEQVVDNLLANALRYVPAGGTVELSIDSAPSTDGPRYRMTVADDGPGLAPEDLPHVFERFYRSAASRGLDSEHQAGGSGLGLAIVREIVERHGGSARAAPRAPSGLVIEVELPARPPRSGELA